MKRRRPPFDEGSHGFANVFGLEEGGVPSRDVVETRLNLPLMVLVHHLLDSLDDKRWIVGKLATEGARPFQQTLLVVIDRVDQSALQRPGLSLIHI